jgi:HAMP domain-containing protein
MEWKQAIREERAALGRIVALLIALAGLAERAAGRSAIVRALVLGFLRRAEIVAREFVDGDLTSIPPADGTPADALRLAASLRALAGQVDRQARSIVARRRQDIPVAPFPMPPLPGLANNLSATVASRLGTPLRLLAPDTS